jgi:iron-sulfur cluster assembly protein
MLPMNDSTHPAPAIRLTERAAAHVRNFLARAGSGVGLRLAVRPTGCSGYQYVVEAATGVNDGDSAFDCNGVRVVVDQLSLRYLEGTELDYVREGLQEQFRFNNPNVAETCGCGESFSIASSATD